MAYTLTTGITLGSSETGLTLEAQLVDTTGADVGSAVISGFVEIGAGNYMWTYAAYPDGFRGGVKFSVVAGAFKAFAAVNPEDALVPIIPELPVGQPPKTPTLLQATMLGYMTLRNKLVTRSTKQQIHNDAGTPIANSTLTKEQSQFTKEKLQSGG